MPGTSSSSTGNSNGGGGGGGVAGGGSSNAVTSNGNNSGNVVPSRNLTTTGEGLSVPTLAAVPSSRSGFPSLSRPSASSGSRKKALHQTPLYNGLLNSYEDKSNDFVW